ncbi:unnamed protein product, partial [Discosporangium mesarthrocarpum]
ERGPIEVIPVFPYQLMGSTARGDGPSDHPSATAPNGAVATTVESPLEMFMEDTKSATPPGPCSQRGHHGDNLLTCIFNTQEEDRTPACEKQGEDIVDGADLRHPEGSVARGDGGGAAAKRPGEEFLHGNSEMALKGGTSSVKDTAGGLRSVENEIVSDSPGKKPQQVLAARDALNESEMEGADSLVGVGARATSMERLLMPPPPPNVARAKLKRRRSRVCLMHSPRYQHLCCLLRRHEQRDNILYPLIEACGLLKWVRVVEPAQASAEHLDKFHDTAYIEASQRETHKQTQTQTQTQTALDDFGLLDDCEVFAGLYEYCTAVAGASLHAASLLVRGEADVAINWGGGRHHAKKGEASGLCYVNDCVLATLHLGRRFQRVLYLDIDIHHGDGLQEAFYLSDRVVTVSFHHLSKGFFPGSGRCAEKGIGRGLNFNVNVPLKEGCGDTTFCSVFTRVLSEAVGAFKPRAVIMQCGADTLSGDPLGCFNLTSGGVKTCVNQV